MLPARDGDLQVPPPDTPTHLWRCFRFLLGLLALTEGRGSYVTREGFPAILWLDWGLLQSSVCCSISELEGSYLIMLMRCFNTSLSTGVDNFLPFDSQHFITPVFLYTVDHSCPLPLNLILTRGLQWALLRAHRGGGDGRSSRQVGPVLDVQVHF